MTLGSGSEWTWKLPFTKMNDYYIDCSLKKGFVHSTSLSFTNHFLLLKILLRIRKRGKVGGVGDKVNSTAIISDIQEEWGTSEK